MGLKTPKSLDRCALNRNTPGSVTERQTVKVRTCADLLSEKVKEKLNDVQT